jgi:outer membrane protein assembly factor BamB
MVSARAAGATCAGTSHHGGDWRSLNHDLAGTRSQPAEDVIDRENVSTIAPRWAFPIQSVQPGTQLDGTPVVADGCVFLEITGSTTGSVVALNADSGALVWQHQITVGESSEGALIGSPAVDAGKIIVLVDAVGAPAAVALDEATGHQVWSTVFDTAPTSFAQSSAVVWNGLVFAAWSGDEFRTDARGGFAVLDESSGAVLAHTYTIPDADYAYGYRGASIWSTAAIDSATGFAYVGTGNPGGCHRDASGNCVSQARIAHPNADAILKIDLNRTSASFGQIVASYRGTPEQYIEGLDGQPACDLAGNIQWGQGTDGSPQSSGNSLTCLQQDLDFGASPALFKDAAGHRVVGELQKSGIYHVVARDTMTPEWTAIIGPPCFLGCNIGTPGTDRDGIYAGGSPPGQMVSLGLGGNYRWTSPVADGSHLSGTSTANGVAYTVDINDNLIVFDTATGIQLLRRSLFLDANSPSGVVQGQVNKPGGIVSTGVAIARHMIYAAGSGYLVAYATTGA